jgi:hypothetical protein
MTQHSFARAAAETHFQKTQKPAQEGEQARTERAAASAAVDAHTARLRELRLDKKRTDEAAAVLITPAPRQKSRLAKPV